MIWFDSELVLVSLSRLTSKLFKLDTYNSGGEYKSIVMVVNVVIRIESLKIVTGLFE